MTEYLERVDDAREAEGMAYVEDLQRAHQKGERITKCQELDCYFKILDKWEKSDSVWTEYPNAEGYMEYSHGMCPKHAEESMAEIQKFLEEQRKLKE